jgi:hypothetical protein
MQSSPVLAAVALVACASAARQQTAPASTSPQQQASPTDPKPFVAKVNEDLKRLLVDSSTADSIKSTYITDEYFQPLRAWLKQQNQGKQCGW